MSLAKIAIQERMPPIPTDKMTDAQKKAAEELVAGPRRALRGPFIPLLRSPELMARLQKVGAYLRFESTLEAKFKELVILMTARQWTQQFEWDSHFPLAVKAGLNPEVLEAIAEGRRPIGMLEEEILYDFCAELHQNQSVSDVTYGRTVKRFGEQGVIDIIGITGYYAMMAMILNVARVPFKDKPQSLVPFPHLSRAE